jgi:hypothetical protein
MKKGDPDWLGEACPAVRICAGHEPDPRAVRLGRPSRPTCTVRSKAHEDEGKHSAGPETTLRTEMRGFLAADSRD